MPINPGDSVLYRPTCEELPPGELTSVEWDAVVIRVWSEVCVDLMMDHPTYGDYEVPSVFKGDGTATRTWRDKP